MDAAYLGFPVEGADPALRVERPLHGPAGESASDHSDRPERPTEVR
jgi:hypothetical protein